MVKQTAEHVAVGASAGCYSSEQTGSTPVGPSALQAHHQIQLCFDLLLELRSERDIFKWFHPAEIQNAAPPHLNPQRSHFNFLFRELAHCTVRLCSSLDAIGTRDDLISCINWVAQPPSGKLQRGAAAVLKVFTLRRLPSFSPRRCSLWGASGWMWVKTLWPWSRCWGRSCSEEKNDT